MKDARTWAIFHQVFPFLALTMSVLILQIIQRVYKYNDTFYGLKNIIKTIIPKCYKNQ